MNEKPRYKQRKDLQTVKCQKNRKPLELTEANIEDPSMMWNSLLTRYPDRVFWHKIMTGAQKWIHYDNPKHNKSWTHPSEPSTTPAKRNIHERKIMLCIW